MNFNRTFHISGPFWFTFGIMYVHITIHITAFRENRVAEGCTSVMGANKITQICAPPTIPYFGS